MVRSAFMSTKKIGNLVETIKNKYYEDYEELKKDCEELEKLSRECHDLYGLSCAKINVAYYYLANGLYTECRDCLNEGIVISEKENYEDLLVRGYNTFALLYKNLFDDNMALEYFLKAIQLATKNKNTEYLGKVMNNVGDMFLQIRDYSMAFPYFIESYTYVKKQPDSANKYLTMMIVLLNIADVEQHLGKYQESLDHMIECESLLEQTGLTVLLDSIYAYKAYAHYYLGNIEEANQCINTLIDSMDDIIQDDLVNSFELYCKIVELLIKMEDSEKCEIFVSKLLEIADQLKTPRFKMEAMEWNIKYRKALLNGEGLIDCYEKFFDYSMDNVIQSFKNRSDSLKIKLDLMNALLEKEEIEKINAELEELSILDELTGIPNRRSFNKKLSKAMKCMNKEENIGIIIADVDYFKQYNDHYGHMAGDEVLRSVAKCLQNEDERFYPTRFGGDEFIIIACNVSPEEIENYIRAVYLRIQACRLEHVGSPDYQSVTISVGYCCSKVAEATTKLLVEKADEALYRAKEAGRNRFFSASIKE